MEDFMGNAWIAAVSHVRNSPSLTRQLAEFIDKPYCSGG
jgi:hypothetical protein